MFNISFNLNQLKDIVTPRDKPVETKVARAGVRSPSDSPPDSKVGGSFGDSIERLFGGSNRSGTIIFLVVIVILFVFVVKVL